jgi:hypothetical protein
MAEHVTLGRIIAQFQFAYEAQDLLDFSAWIISSPASCPPFRGRLLVTVMSDAG